LDIEQRTVDGKKVTEIRIKRRKKKKKKPWRRRNVLR